MMHQGAGVDVSDPRRAAMRTVSDSETTSPGRAKPDQVQFEEEIDFSHYARFLIRYWKLLAACVLVGGAAGAAFSLSRPVLYAAATTILASQADAQVGTDNFRALVVNSSIASETIQEMGLDKPPYRLTPQRFLSDVLSVEDIRLTNFLRVTVTLPDPSKATETSTRYARKAVELNRRIASGESAALRGELQEHVAAAAGRWKEAEQQLLAYQNGAQLDVLRTDTSAMLDERGRLLKLLIDIEAEKAKLTAAEQEIQKQEPVLTARRSVAVEEALRRAARASSAIPVQPPGSVMADPESLDLSDPFVNPVYQTLRFQIAMSRTRLAGLERARREMVSAHQLTKLTELNARELELVRLQGNYDLAKRVHADLALRYEQSRSEAVTKMVQLQIVDEATVPEQPLPRKRLQSAALGMVGGLILAILAALAWEARMRSRFASRS